MTIKNKRGFTLIELLVVITIIGILATWATSVYTSQIQKARDTTRINDVTALKSWLEQLYQDSWTYPNAWLAIAGAAWSFTWVKVYTPKLPKDPKTWQKSTNSNFDYVYSVADDTSWIGYQTYEISATFENAWTVSSKAWGDGWNDDNRLEMWISVSGLLTASNITVADVPTSWVDTATIPADSCATSAEVWATAVVACPTAALWSSTNVEQLIIK